MCHESRKEISMPIEGIEQMAESLGISDTAAFTDALEKFETDRLKARQTVIDKAQGELRAFTELGLTPDEIKALKDKPGPTSEKDIEKIINDRVKEVETAQTERLNAKARASEVRAQAAELGFIKPAQALALLDPKKLADIPVNDDGDADEAAVKKLLEELKTDSPHLLKPTDTTAHHRDAGIGATGSGNQPDVRPGADRLRQAYANTNK
jgi:DNA-binding transcriptional MerR regulator